MKNLKSKIFPVVIVILILFVVLKAINSYFGWYGYQQWSYRMGTYGDRKEAIERKIYIKSLKYHSSTSLPYFDAYIEKGFWFGHHSMNVTDFHKTAYPYQVSIKQMDTTNNVIYEIMYPKDFDSVDMSYYRTTIFLKKPVLKDTLVLKIVRFDKDEDSVGCIKIWE